MKKVVAIIILALFSLVLFLNLQIIPEDQLIENNASVFYRANGLEETNSLNLVTAILYDFRAFDSLGESTVIFAAVSGIVLVLSRKTLAVSSHGLSFIVKRTFAILTPFIFLFSIYVITHGHLSPGGGFQGGVILASISIIFIIIYGSAFDYKMVSPNTKTVLETGGALTFLLIGFIGLMIEGVFLSNIKILNQGIGSLFSAGSIPIVNIGIGLKVGAGLAIIFYSMIQKTLERSWVSRDK
ncbi:MAG TPA: hydrogen gas-evolving membrane-bound hydrogenase subunit E [Halanaerobiales bacterium]|nr:hydrogen gas-evolving membrane-bound hydrogenase subunit E [Halanaerobiales bacterium]